MLVNKRNISATILLYMSILPFKQVMVAAGLCAPLIVGRLKKHELVKFFSLSCLLLIPLINSAYSNPINLVFSLLLLFPFVYLLNFSESLISNLEKINLSKFLDLFIYLLILNGSIGLVQYGIYRHDDAAIGFYGRSSLQVHGLAIIYFMAALYMISRPVKTANVIKSGLLLLFMLSCFYGAGLVAAVFALALSSLLFSKNKLKMLSISVLGLSLIGIAGWLISPNTMIYNYIVLNKFFEGISSIVFTGTADTLGMPRKLVVWLAYFQAITDSTHSFITGFGAGAFNSRAAFLLNGDYASVSFLPISISNIHSVYVMPLWSSDILSQAYSDGTMNQPFSSILAVLAEYGALGLIFIFLGIRRFQRAINNCNEQRTQKTRYLNSVLVIFFMTLCLFDNILEYPEIVIPFFIFAIGINTHNKNTLISKNL